MSDTEESRNKRGWEDPYTKKKLIRVQRINLIADDKPTLILVQELIWVLALHAGPEVFQFLEGIWECDLPVMTPSFPLSSFHSVHQKKNKQHGGTLSSLRARRLGSDCLFFRFVSPSSSAVSIKARPSSAEELIKTRSAGNC